MAGGAAAEQRYVVQPGDTLKTIAEKFYGDSGKWPLILRANQDKLAGEGAAIPGGTELAIPELDLETAPTYGVAQGQRDKDSGLVMIDLIAVSDMAPFSGEDLPNGGLITEIVTTAFHKLGYEPAIKFVPPGAPPDPANLGNFAAAFPHQRSAALERDFLLSDGMLPTRSLAYWHKDQGATYAQAEDLRGRRVCMTKALYGTPLRDKLQAHAVDLVLADKAGDCFRAVKEQVIDAVIAGDLAGGAALAELGLEGKIGVSQTPFHTGEFSVLFPKLSSSGRVLRYQFNEAIEKMKSSGELDRIVERHLRPGAQEVAATPGATGFAVVLAAFKTRDDAERYSAWVQKSMAETLGSLTLETETLVGGSNGPAFRVTTEPLDNERMAREVCIRLGWPTCEVVER